MSQFILSRRVGVAAFAFGMLALTGCAALKPAAPEQVVEKRVTAYWQARMAGQYEKAYALSTPSYRKLRTESQFRMQFGSSATIERADVKNIECEAEKCKVQLNLGVKPALPGVRLGTVDTFVNEIWLLEDGQWWHHQDL